MIDKKNIKVGDILINNRNEKTIVKKLNGKLVNIGEHHIIHGHMTHEVNDRDANNWRKV